MNIIVPLVAILHMYQILACMDVYIWYTYTHTNIYMACCLLPIPYVLLPIACCVGPGNNLRLGRCCSNLLNDSDLLLQKACWIVLPRAMKATLYIFTGIHRGQREQKKPPSIFHLPSVSRFCYFLFLLLNI